MKSFSLGFLRTLLFLSLVVLVSAFGTHQQAKGVLAAHILHFEGGYVNHSLDRPTNRGVQWQTYKAFAKRVGLNPTKKAFENLTNEQARLFIDLFWQFAQADSIKSPKVAMFFVEEFWASPISIKFYQQKINQMYGCGIQEDAILGKQTIEAINSFSEEEIIPNLLQWKEERYQNIIYNNPKKQIFEKGWKRRREKFKKIITP